jgi:tRNA-specific 2-thiouridylase
MTKPRIIVGLSGGVDSAVTAALLLERGWDVVGVTLRLQPCGGTADRQSCCGSDGVAQARAVAGQLGVPHYVVDCHELFTENVLRRCWEDYASGRTPNPCVLCNRFVKFGHLLEFGRTLGAEKVATGHYAQLLPDADGRIRLHRGVDRNKDQSYFLVSLTPEQLAAAEMPLGGFTKDEVRKLAKERGFVNAERRESQDICFAVDEGGFAEYLRRLFAGTARPGVALDTAGRVVGKHGGVHLFTIGQRKGTGIALGKPAWVKEIRADSATVVMTTDEHDLESAGLTAEALNWHGVPPSEGIEIPCEVQARYRQKPIPAFVTPGPGATASVRFAHPVKAVTPGQAAVFYQGDLVLGGGWIV